MPLLGALLQGLFVALADFLAKFVTRKVATATAAVLAFAALVTGLMATIMTTINSLVPMLPGGQAIDIAIWLAIPSTGPAVVSACLATDAAMALYRWNKQNIALAAAA